jgi:hypothetical protein
VKKQEQKSRWLREATTKEKNKEKKTRNRTSCSISAIFCMVVMVAQMV